MASSDAPAPGRLHRLWQRIRDLFRPSGRRPAVAQHPPVLEPDEVSVPAADGTDRVATVHAVLTPQGLVLIGGVVEAARWAGPGVAPGRGCAVSVSYDADGGRWAATAPVAAAQEGTRS